MNTLAIFFVLLFGHFLGFYVFQAARWTLDAPSIPNVLWRSLAYSVTLTVAFLAGVTAMQVAVPFLLYSALVFFVVMFVTTLVIDVGSTKVSNNLWAREKYKAFLSVVGFEQLLHQYVLLATALYLVG